jgi:hypothetical protein
MAFPPCGYSEGGLPGNGRNSAVIVREERPAVNPLYSSVVGHFEPGGTHFQCRFPNNKHLRRDREPQSKYNIIDNKQLIGFVSQKLQKTIPIFGAPAA